MSGGKWKLCTLWCVAALVYCLTGCSTPQASPATSVVRVDASDVASVSAESDQFSDVPELSSSARASKESSSSGASAPSSASSEASASSHSAESGQSRAEKLFKKLGIVKDFRDLFVHGKKPVKYQKYIVLHDTETGGSPEDVVNSWDGSERRVAAHFVVGKDGSIVQCVPLDKIAHHAGYGDTGHNEQYGVEDESRDDMVRTTPIGDWASDYGMNSYSVGIEMIHIGGEGDYPEAQLEALDGLIEYIDTYYGKQSKIIDHKAWRTGNSDTSEEFADYLANYQSRRTHD